MRGFNLRNPVHPASCLISLSTRSRGQPASLVVASAEVPDIPQVMSRGLGREGKLRRVCCCLFDPIVNGANESSPACHPDRRLPVETRTSPISIDGVIIRPFFVGSSGGTHALKCSRGMGKCLWMQNSRPQVKKFLQHTSCLS